MPSAHSPWKASGAGRPAVCQKPATWVQTVSCHGAVQNHPLLPDEFLPVLGNDGLLTVNAGREEEACSLGRVVHSLLNVLAGRYSDDLARLQPTARSRC